MSGYRAYTPPQPLLVGYDPVRDLPAEHLARLVEQVVEDAIHPAPRRRVEGQPPYDPRLCLKVLLYGYATGVRSSRRLEQHCRESLPYLYLTRGDTPSYRTLAAVRKTRTAELEAVWEGLLAVGAAAQIHRLGQIVVDSSRWAASAGREATVEAQEVAAVLAEFRRILAEAAACDAAEEETGPRSTTRLEQAVPPEQVRDILRRVRREQAARAAAAPSATPDPDPEPPRRGGTPHGPSAQPALALDLPLPGEPAAREPPPPAPAGHAPGAAEAPTARPQAASAPAAGKAAPRTPALRRRLEALVAVLTAAQAEGRKQVNLTDPDAGFMPLGATKKVGLGHSFEAATDQGLRVVGQRGDGGNDNARLEPILEVVQARTPTGVRSVDGDSGFYRGEVIGKLLAAQVDVCIPDSNTACDLHRRQPIGTTRKRTGEWAFLTWDAEARLFRCAGGNELRETQVREEHGQTWTVYRAVAPCTGCPHAPECLQRRDAKHRTVRLGVYHVELEAARQRFKDPAQQARYRQRGPAIETVFGFIAQVLGYRGWWLRGKAGTAAEAQWIGLAYLTRKVAGPWRTGKAVAR